MIVPLGLLMLYSQRNRGPMDDPDQAFQRPGFLSDAVGAVVATPLPELAIAAPAMPAPGARSLLVFVRANVPQTRMVLDDLNRGVVAEQMASIVVISSAPLGETTKAPAIADPDSRVARAYGMRRPADGGYPLGYAIVDTRQRVRYATLDPALADHWDEVETMLRATP